MGKNNRRNFLRNGLLATAGVIVAPRALEAAKSNTVPGNSMVEQDRAKPVFKNWIWVNPDKKQSQEEINKVFSSYANAGIHGIFFEQDSELHFRTAKRLGMEAHRWMWTLNRGDKELLEEHPDWYAVSRKGDSCSDKPPYVDYYRWLCPSKKTTLEFLSEQVEDILSKDYVDGIHLDYVRYCDVILPLNLWSNYHIEQTKELPEYDFCYCNHCQQEFQEWSGQSLSSMEFPEASLSWRQFRYNQINHIVNQLAVIAKSHQKLITAAVFPTPEVARRNVRQDWTNWNIDAVCPMIYHGFYKENVRWIGDAVAEGVHFLDNKKPIYAGLFLPDFKSSGELKEGIGYALKNGAAGISFFGDVSDGDLACLQEMIKKYEA